MPFLIHLCKKFLNLKALRKTSTKGYIYSVREIDIEFSANKAIGFPGGQGVIAVQLRIFLKGEGGGVNSVGFFLLI